ncbi:hypothetical protein LCGC14_0346110 [marine sediment metagenome]|uniref:Uncharacterized protein n=1 Tax=marine sediment metagenome TaxID=412755 RepID=A0A0F9THX6_9ZZZZ
MNSQEPDDPKGLHYTCPHCGKTFPKFMGEEARGHMVICKELSESQEPDHTPEKVSEFVEKMRDKWKLKKRIEGHVSGEDIYELCNKLEAETNLLENMTYERDRWAEEAKDRDELAIRNDNQRGQIIELTKRADAAESDKKRLKEVLEQDASNLHQLYSDQQEGFMEMRANLKTAESLIKHYGIDEKYEQALKGDSNGK